MTAWSLLLARSLQRPVAARDRERAALHLLDWLACAHLGQSSPEAAPLRRWAEAQPAGPAWTCGGHALQPADAARFHGSLGSLHEMDDVHREAVVHPGDTVVPAALAVAQREGCSADDLLDALVVGYEAGIRLGLLAGPAHYRHWYSTATTGAFAAAMACARLLRLPADASAHALALAGMQSAGVWQCRMEPGLAKQVAAGHAAQAGLVAADLAAAGATGPLSILEGEHGWLRATGSGQGLAGGQATDASHDCLAALDDAPWRLHEVSFKPWPACRHVHPAIACALQALTLGVRPGEVDRLELRTYRVALDFADQPLPATAHQARFSLQHALAWTLLQGDFGIEASQEPASLADPACAALRARVSLSVDARHEQDYPRRFGASLRVHLAEGRCVDIDQPHALGDPELPLDREAVRAKAVRLLVSSGLDVSQAEGLAAHALALPGGAGLQSWWGRLSQVSRACSQSSRP